MEELPEIDESSFRIANQKMMITYKTHIDKKKLIALFTDLNKKECKFIRVAHENADDNNPYEHCHLLVDFGKIFQSRDCRIFDIDGIHPNIKKVTTMTHWKNSLSYLAKEDPENSDLADQRTIVEKVWDSESKQEALMNCKRAGDALGILALYENKPREIIEEKGTFRTWQRRLFFDINAVVDDRQVIWYVDPIGNYGKSWFCRYMMIHHADKVLVMKQMGGQKDCSTVIANAIDGGWKGDTILIDLPRAAETREIYAPIEDMKSGMITTLKYQGKCILFNKCHVVVMANFEPDRTKMSADRWDIRYAIDGESEDEEEY